MGSMIGCAAAWMTIVGMGLAPAGSWHAGPPSVASSAPDFSGPIERGRELLASLQERGDMPGLQFGVAHRGRVVFTEGFGHADLEHEVAATAETRFGIGSISKSLTMATIGSLVDDGVIDLDEPIETYLPDYPHAGRGVTIRLIAGHLSGLSDGIATGMRLTRRHFGSALEAYEIIKDEPLVAEPGEAHMYATGPYTLIGAAAEAATGERFVDLVRSRVLEPAGMRRTVVNDPRAIVAHRTVFYDLEEESGQIVHVPTYDPSIKLPGAGYVSTCRDLCRFGSALLAGELVSEATRRELFTTLEDASGQDTGYALGFRVQRDARDELVVHQPGGGPGISSWLFIYPERELVFAVLANRTAGPVGARETMAVIDEFLDAAP